MARLSRLGWLALLLCGAIGFSTAAMAQPGPGGPPGRGFGGGGFGPMMGGMGGMASPTMLLNADAVAKELKLTDDQKAKIRQINEKAQATMREAFEGLADLSPEERQEKMAGLREKMQNQRKETNKALEAVLTEDQAKRLKEVFIQVLGEQSLRNPEVQAALGLSDDQKAKIRSILEILTDDQKAAFAKMKGEKFDVNSIRMGGPGMGGFGPGGAGGERRRPPAAKTPQ